MGTNEIIAVQVPQFVFAIWNDRVSGVLKLLALITVSQKGESIPDTVYANAAVFGAVTWIDRVDVSVRLTVVELTVSLNCARPGAAIPNSTTRNRTVSFNSL